MLISIHKILYNKIIFQICLIFFHTAGITDCGINELILIFQFDFMIRDFL